MASGVSNCCTTPPASTQTRSDMLMASVWSCVTNRVVIPTSRCRRLSSICISSRNTASRLDSGSSNNRMLGRGAIERATATRCCWPPESCLGMRPPRPDRRTLPKACSTRVRKAVPAMPWRRSPKATFSNTVMWGNNAYDWNTSPTWRRLGGSRVISRSSTRMRPLVGAIRPATMRSTVVLPQPDGPSSDTNSPSFTDNETPAAAVCPS
ncbi:hypothetical protein D9M68_603150 [compost metagenome]